MTESIQGILAKVMETAECSSCGQPELEVVMTHGLCERCSADPHGSRSQRKAEATEARERFRHLRRWTRLSKEDAGAIAKGTHEPTLAVRHVTRWMEGERPVLLLSGPVGTGKTMAAAVAAADHRGPVIPAADLPQHIDPWGNEADRFEPVHPRRSGLVVLDDLGTEEDNSRWAQAFGSFVDARQADGRTLITTNLPKRAIRPRYGDRVADRLNHVGVAVEITGASMRRKGAL